MAWSSELSLPGYLVNYLLKEMRPKDLKVTPDELFPLSSTDGGGSKTSLSGVYYVIG